MSDSCEPMDCSPPSSSVYGIIQAGVLGGLPFPSPGDLPCPGIQPASSALQVYSLPLSHLGSPQKAYHVINTWMRKQARGNRSKLVTASHVINCGAKIRIQAGWPLSSCPLTTLLSWISVQDAGILQFSFLLVWRKKIQLPKWSICTVSSRSRQEPLEHVGAWRKDCRGKEEMLPPSQQMLQNFISLHFIEKFKHKNVLIKLEKLYISNSHLLNVKYNMFIY